VKAVPVGKYRGTPLLGEAGGEATLLAGAEGEATGVGAGLGLLASISGHTCGPSAHVRGRMIPYVI
jgi:hypothetical protein